MCNLCRSFTLFHDKIMINRSCEKDKEFLEKNYHVIGYFDWFQTRKLEINSESPSDLEKLFDYNLELNDCTSEYQSFQNIFGFRDDTDKKDSNFWIDTLDNPIRFVLFLQLEEYGNDCYNWIDEALKECCLLENQKIENYILYHTLDKNDFVICFKSNFYRKIMNIINNLYMSLLVKNVNIIYSYTNVIIKNDASDNVLSSIKKINETIDSICIKTILNNYNITHLEIPQKIDLFCQKISSELYPGQSQDALEKKNIIGYEILGDTDCRYIARNVPLNLLLRCFLKGGILSRYDDDFTYCFVSSMTSLNVNYGNNLYDYNSKERNNKVFVDSKMKQTFKKRIIEIQMRLGNDFRPISTLLHQITKYLVFSVYKAEEKKYGYDIMIDPIDVLLDIIIKNIENIKLDKISVDDLYEYLNTIYNYLQENARTDIRFTGISDYSMMSYYSPTKLREFYTLVVNIISKNYARMSQLDNNIRYSFLIFFTYSQTTYVDQLWKNRFEEDKLMMVKISEKDFYNIKDLVFQLAHEVAHFVGNEDIRNRRSRFYGILRYVFYKVYIFLKKKLSEEQIAFSKTIDNKKSFFCFYEKHLSFIENGVNTFINQLINDSEIEKEYDFFYMGNVENFIMALLFDWKLLKNYFDDYYEYLINQQREELLSKDISLNKAQDIIRNLYYFKKKISMHIEKYKQNGFLIEGSDYNYIKVLMNECYADMSAILSFDLSVTDFLEFIQKRIDINFRFSDEDKVLELIDGNVLLQRSCIIIKAFSEIGTTILISDNFKTYDDFLQGKYNNQEETKLLYSTIAKVSNSIGVKLDHPANYVCEYLKNCIKSYYYNYDIIAQNEIKKIYSSIDDNKTINIIKYINNYVAEESNELIPNE